MKRVLCSTLLVSVLLLVSANPVAAAWPDPEQVTTVDALVRQVMREAHIPGMALGIVDGDGAVYLKGFGAADGAGRPVTAETPFILGSLSKSFTVMAALQLAAAGKLDLDAPVQRYLPWFRVADASASAQITVRNLLNHTSGLPRAAANFEAMNDGRTTSEQTVRRMAGLKLTAAPGQLYQYCNLNYTVVGLIVANSSGLPYAA